MKFDKDEIRVAAQASARAVFDFYGRKCKRSGGQLESSWCPACGDHSRRTILLHPTKLVWHCKVCGAGGDIFKMIELADGITGFPRVLERAAEIWSVLPSSAPLEERIVRREAAKARAEEIERRALAEAKRLKATEHPRSARYWNLLQVSHEVGARYLEQRGLAQALALVRFDRRLGGAPAVPLFASDGRIKNVVRRPMEPGDKPFGLFGCSTSGTLVDAVTSIEGHGVDVVITEGLADTLTAKLAFNGAFALGTHGAGNLEKVAKVAAPRIASARGRLRLIPHQDKAGITEAAKAAKTAIKAGLSIGRGSLVIVKTGAKDLNEAWCAGWKP